MRKVEAYECSNCGRRFYTKEECRLHERSEAYKVYVSYNFGEGESASSPRVELKEESLCCIPSALLYKYFDVVDSKFKLSLRHVEMSMYHVPEHRISFSIVATASVKDDACEFLLKHVQSVMLDMYTGICGLCNGNADTVCGGGLLDRFASWVYSKL